jgi:hypothetical protein
MLLRFPLKNTFQNIAAFCDTAIPAALLVAEVSLAIIIFLFHTRLPLKTFFFPPGYMSLKKKSALSPKPRIGLNTKNFGFRRPGCPGWNPALDPLLCVPDFHRVCLSRITITYPVKIIVAFFW